MCRWSRAVGLAMTLASPVVNRWQRIPTVQGKAGMLRAKCLAIQALLMLLDLLGWVVISMQCSLYAAALVRLSGQMKSLKAST